MQQPEPARLPFSRYDLEALRTWRIQRAGRRRSALESWSGALPELRAEDVPRTVRKALGRYERAKTREDGAWQARLTREAAHRKVERQVRGAKKRLGVKKAPQTLLLRERRVWREFQRAREVWKDRHGSLWFARQAVHALARLHVPENPSPEAATRKPESAQAPDRKVHEDGLLAAKRERLSNYRRAYREGRLTKARYLDRRRDHPLSLEVSPLARPVEQSGFPLSLMYERLLTEGEDGQDADYRVALGAYCSKWPQERLMTALLDPAHVSGEEVRRLHETSPEDALAMVRDLRTRAAAFADRNPSKAKECAMRARIERIRGRADALIWKNEAGHVDLAVLHALLNLAAWNADKLARRYTYPAVSKSARDLCRSVCITKDTASVSLRRLQRRGWLSRWGEEERSQTDTNAAAYVLTVPADAPKYELPLPVMPEHMLASAAFDRRALSLGALHAWRLVWAHADGMSVSDVADATRRQVNTVRPLVRRLAAVGLLKRQGTRFIAHEPNPAELDDIAEGYGTLKVVHTRRRNYARQTLAWRKAAPLIRVRAADGEDEDDDWTEDE